MGESFPHVWLLVFLLWIQCSSWGVARTLADLSQTPQAVSQLDQSTAESVAPEFMFLTHQAPSDESSLQEATERLFIRRPMSRSTLLQYPGLVADHTTYTIPLTSAVRDQLDKEREAVAKRGGERFPTLTKRQLNAVERAVVRQEILRRIGESSNPVEIPIGLRFRRVMATADDYAPSASDLRPFLDAFFSPPANLNNNAPRVEPFGTLQSTWRNGSPKQLYW